MKEITDRISDIEFDMVTMRFDKSHPKFERVGNINIYRIGGGLGYLSKILFVLQATAFALKHKYDSYWAMMTYMLFPVVLVRLLGKKTNYSLTLQDGDPFTHVFNRLRIFFFRPLLYWGFRKASKVQAISTFLAGWARKMGHKKEVEVIPNGVDLSKFRIQNFPKKENNKIKLITTSRLVKKNAVEDIIESLQYLPENVELEVIGSGPLDEYLKLRAENLNLEKRVKFLGEIANENLPPYLYDADIFVRPSLSEGQGISFIEAMAAGLPVVATPVGGITDFLKDRETGLICKVNDPKNIADKVMEYINNPELKEMIIKNARDMVIEKYDWNMIAKKMKTLVFEPLF